MAPFFRGFPKVRGGSALWSDGSPASALLINETFGASGPIVVALGAAVETDAAQPITRASPGATQQPIAPALETDAATAVARLKRRLFAASLETDAALPVMRRKLRAPGIALETDIALLIAGRKRRALGVAPETDTALQVTAAGTPPPPPPAGAIPPTGRVISVGRMMNR